MHVAVTPEAAQVPQRQMLDRALSPVATATGHGQEALILRVHMSLEAASAPWKDVMQGLVPPEATEV